MRQKQSRKNESQKREAFNLVKLQSRTAAQKAMMDAYLDDLNVIASGSAGTGKSYVACYLALKDLFEKEKDRIVIVRSTVPTRDQGFLPGTVEEKQAVYQLPYVGIVNELCQNGAAWEILKKKDMIQFITTSYVRGITLDNACIIIDEFQNMNQEELYSVLTRVGENTQVILCGDTRQTDLKKEKTAFYWLESLSHKMPDWFRHITFHPEDIVRSDFVKALIIANESMN